MAQRPKSLRTSRPVYDKQRGTARQRGYTTQWDKASRLFKKRNPLCAECMKQGKMTASYKDCNGREWPNEVDHIIPHRGDMQLFWDESNWQTLCKRCHCAKTRSGR